MRRRFSTRDFGLSVRMVAALSVIAVIYVGTLTLTLWVTVVAVQSSDLRGVLGGAMFTLAIPFALWQQYAMSGDATLRAVGAHAETPYRDLDAAVQKLAASADMPPPLLLVAPSSTANALAVPIHQGRSAVVVTSALLDKLEPKEVEAVIGHELAHLANRDGEVMTFVAGPALACASWWHDPGRAKLLAVMLSPVWLIGLLVLRAVSRYREFAADRGSAILTAAPEQLMSALVKLANEQAIGDLRGGRAVEALCIVGYRRPILLADHPPLEKRLAALAKISREMGKPAA